jgi:hypothetical protein
MKKFMKVSVVAVVIFVLGTAGTAFAASFKTPAEIVSALTGKTTDAINSERVEGKTYGAIANDAGKLEEFKTQVLKQKKVNLDQRVKDGTLSQERANAIYDAIEKAKSTCDGKGRTCLGAGCGAKIGAGGCGMGNNLGRGSGRGMGGGFQR